MTGADSPIEEPGCALPRESGKRANARREQVIQAGRILFAERGFHATGIAEIAKQSGVLVGQIYRDFANKEAIVAAIAERDLTEFLDEETLCAARERCCQDAVRDWIGRFIACHEISDKRLIAEILAESARNDRLAAILAAIDGRLRGRLVQALSLLASPAADPHRIEVLADLVMTMSFGIFHRRLNGEPGPAPELHAALMACVDAQLDALARPMTKPQ